MNDETKRKYEQELIEEGKQIRGEVNHDPDVVGVTAPPEMHENILNAIRKREEERAKENLSEEDKELLRLGANYKRRRKYRKYIVLAAALILIIAFGVTSVGGPERLFEKIKVWALGREYIQVNSEEGIELVTKVDEEEVYEEIEEKFGFAPVRIVYLPEGIEFQEATIYDDIQGIQMIYGKNEMTNVAYLIRPNYREGSFGTDIEDNVVKEFLMEQENARIVIKQYTIGDTEEFRWTAEFEYQDVQYFMMIMNVEEPEIEKIIKNLIFL